ncbi:MAG: hypothetical protein ACLFWD_08410 [Anaerolineales bacterium]
MARVLFLFMDGVGLGSADESINPLAAAAMPNLRSLLDGQPMVLEAAPFEGDKASLISLDAQLGVEGTPQSATGQAVLLTGKNVPAAIGRHYGPKPNPEVAAFIKQDNLFCRIRRRDGQARLVNAYPPQYFEAIDSGRRLLSAVPLAVHEAGIPLMTTEDLRNGKAMSADFTGAGWTARTEFPDIPVYEGPKAGELLAEISFDLDLAFFDYWASDYAGHKQAFDRAVSLMESFDDVLGGVISAWEDRPDLILLTSDHGNMEDMRVRGHTLNPVPGLLIGPRTLRQKLTRQMSDLTSVAPAVMTTIYGDDWDQAWTIAGP